MSQKKPGHPEEKTVDSNNVERDVWIVLALFYNFDYMNESKLFPADVALELEPARDEHKTMWCSTRQGDQTDQQTFSLPKSWPSQFNEP